MEFKPLSKWEMKVARWKLCLKKIYCHSLSFAVTYLPFSHVFFDTLMYFEVQDRYKRRLKIQKQAAAPLTRAGRKELRKQAKEEYLKDLEKKAELAEMMNRKSRQDLWQLRSVLNEFTAFLVKSFEKEEVIRIAKETSKLLDPKDQEGTLQRVRDYASSVKKKYSENHENREK